MTQMLPVTIVTGFLGAGKTTLVNQWLARSTRGDIAMIINEHGDVGIDGQLLADRARLLIEVSGGCVCCTTYAELVQALDTIAGSTTPPKRILIETSGAASPAGVVRAIVAGGKSGALILDGVITVFDATRVNATLEHDLAHEQLGYADVVVMSRSDQCSATDLAQAKATLSAHNGAAVFVDAARGDVVSPALTSLDDLLAQRRLSLFVQPPVPTTHAPHVYESVSLTHEGEVDGERFAEFVEVEVGQFAGRIFRLKGILAVADLDLRMIVQGVTDSVEITFGAPWGDTPRTSRLVIVGFGLEREALANGFRACAK